MYVSHACNSWNVWGHATIEVSRVGPYISAAPRYSAEKLPATAHYSTSSSFVLSVEKIMLDRDRSARLPGAVKKRSSSKVLSEKHRYSQLGRIPCVKSSGVPPLSWCGSIGSERFPGFSVLLIPAGAYVRDASTARLTLLEDFVVSCHVPGFFAGKEPHWG